MRRELVTTSKLLSLVLRHSPGKFGVSLDGEGWASVPELLQALQTAGHPISRDLLREVVETNEKRRFALSQDGERIRARQGHSLDVDLGLEPIAPPRLLYHGTATRYLNSIRGEGLLKNTRQFVHLSPNDKTAHKVGERHGKPIVLIVRAGELAATGAKFYLSENGVWLTDHVPPEFLEFPEQAAT